LTGTSQLRIDAEILRIWWLEILHPLWKSTVTDVPFTAKRYIMSQLSRNFAILFFLSIFTLFAIGPALAEANLDGKVIKGTVEETMNTGGYTYLKVKAPEGEVWVAIPETTVKKGQEVVCSPGMTMTDFESKSLGRTFASIIFSPGLATAGAMHGGGHGNMAVTDANNDFNAALQAEQSGHGGMGAMGGAAMGGAAAMAASGGSAGAIVPSKEIKVEKATGENACTVGECFARAKELDNKKVRVRGKVVKVSRMIMGRNWVHIQDGTGNPMENTHDLVVTTQADPELDSVVTVEGTLHANRDFGAGYKYDAIVEDAEIK